MKKMVRRLTAVILSGMMALGGAPGASVTTFAASETGAGDTQNNVSEEGQEDTGAAASAYNELKDTDSVDGSLDDGADIAGEAKVIEMYRLYNPNSGEHFYTASKGEKDVLASLGWKYEGIGWNAPSAGEAVYRLYNKNGGEHHYTLNPKERDMLVGVGWSYEGIGWYSDTEKSVPLYRQYNPNAFSNNHNYTANGKERDFLIGLGWKDEGIGWYGTDGTAKTDDEGKAYQLKGIVKSADTGKAVEDVKVVFTPEDGSEAQTAVTGEDGHFSLEGVTGHRYKVNTYEFGYADFEETVTLSDKLDGYEIQLTSADLSTYLGQDFNELAKKYEHNFIDDASDEWDNYIYYDGWLHKDNKVTGIASVDPEYTVAGIHAQDSIEQAIQALSKQGFKNYRDMYRNGQEVNEAYLEFLKENPSEIFFCDFFTIDGATYMGEYGDSFFSNLDDYGMANQELKSQLENYKKEHDGYGGWNQEYITFRKGNIRIILYIPFFWEGDQPTSSSLIYKIKVEDLAFAEEADAYRASQS